MFLENRKTMTSCGMAEGVAAGNPGYTVFRGIPFGKAPEGEFRWYKPLKPEAWENTLQCGQFPAAAIQYPGRNKGTGLYHKEFKPAEVEESEDCLYLNIWTPNLCPEKKLPVMVWIHGGAFSNGYSYEMEFDGEAYCKRDVILVTIPYRLAALGFLAHPELSARENGLSGNYGVLDVIAALKWIAGNIAFFGGDPENVTVFGQSAGGMMINVLCASPLAKGLFQKAIIQSAPITGDMSNLPALTEAEEMGQKMLDYLGTSVEKLMNLPGKRVNEMLIRAAEHLYGSTMKVFKPIVDGYVLEKSPWDVLCEGNYPDINYIVGAVEGDGKIFAAGENEMEYSRRFSAEWMNMQKKSGTKNSYLYYFNRHMPGDSNGAFHSSELWYVFGTLHRCWRTQEKGFHGGDYILSERMLDYWTNFGKSGDPNLGGKEVPAWTEYTLSEPVCMEFNDNLLGMKKMS